MPRDFKRVGAESAKRARPQCARAGGFSDTVALMGKATGFIEYARVKPPARPVAERVGDYRHVYDAYPAEELTRQARAAWTAASRSATRAARSAI